MKPLLLIAFITLGTITVGSTAAAPTDHSYYVTETTVQQKFDVYNDGHNTYLESVPGLVVTGATADGERYIVNGVPRQIPGFMNGKPITVVRGLPPVPKAPVKPDTAAVKEQIKKLSEELSVLTASSDAIAAKQKPAKAAIAAIGMTPTPAGQAASVHPIPVEAPPKPAKVWEVKASDSTLYGTMKRWSKEANMQLMWETENHDVRLRGQASYTGDFDAAVFELMKSFQQSDYPMRACIYDNGAVRIVHTKKSCKG
jgi:hypothetical protein